MEFINNKDFKAVEKQKRISVSHQDMSDTEVTQILT